jgi:TRAP-type transport system periplasmic protein
MLARLVAATLAIATAWISTASATELRLLSSWDGSHPARRILLNTYLKNVEAASNGTLTFKLSGPETVPPFEQLQPVGSGIFHLLFTHSAYHSGTTPYLLPIDAMTGDSKAVLNSGMYELIDKHYQKFGLKLVFLVKPQHDTGYQFVLRAPVGSSGDLQGRKIRGTQTFSGVFQYLRASPVILPPGDIYTAVEKGVVDGFGWPAIGIMDYKWNEVAKYLMRPKMGSAGYFFMVNLAAWNSLTESQRAILTDEGKKIQEFWDPEWLRLVKSEEDALLASGSLFTDLGAEQKSKLGAEFARGVWELTLKGEPRAIAELHEFAKKKGLSD